MEAGLAVTQRYGPRSFLKLLPVAFGAAALLAASMLSGCVSTQSNQPADVNLSGFTQAFKDGYADGCGSLRGSTKRNDVRFKADPHYAQGWRDGLDICRRRQP